MKLAFFTQILKVLVALIVFVIASQPVWAVDISVSVDRNPVTVDESFNIYFSAAEAPGGEPDFTPLEQDFTILNQGQSSNSSWINGQYSKSIRWTVQAMAKKSGTITIPAIIFGNDTSKPLTITVNRSAANANNSASTEDLYMEVKAEPESPYVQSQVMYTVRVYRRVELAQAKLTEPELADAVMEKLGEDSDFNTVINGVSYRVTERKYAIFPQKSGTLKINPLALTADVVLDDSGRGGFGAFFGSPITKTKRVLSNEIVLNVKAAPAGFAGKNWLPAEQLELAQTWSGDVHQMKLGEPVTRTLTLRATGSTVSQLPELNTLKTDANLKAYPDQPVLNEDKLPEGIVASRQEKIALIPSVPGQQTLPAIEIPWFNTKTQRVENARIPETVITVSGSAINPSNTPAQTQSQPKLPDVKAETTENNASIKQPTVRSEDNTKLWQLISLFLALGWVATLSYVLYKRPKTDVNKSHDSEKLATQFRLNELSKQLKDVCNRNDSLGAKNTLLAWGKQQFGVGSLGAIASHCEARLRDEILTLNQHLYSRNASEWNGKKLFQAFSENNARQKMNIADDMVLEPLHRL